MGNKARRAKGAAQEVVGKLKKTAGRIVGSERVEAEGRATELKGRERQAVAKAGERAKGTVEQAGGALKKNLGKLIDNEQMEVEGKAKELVGKTRRKANA